MSERESDQETVTKPDYVSEIGENHENGENTEGEGSKRERKLTEKGKELKLSQLKDHQLKLENSFDAVKDFLSACDTCGDGIRELHEYEKKLAIVFDRFVTTASGYDDFLCRSNLPEFKHEIESNHQKVAQLRQQVETTTVMIQNRVQKQLELSARKSCVSSKNSDRLSGKTSSSHSSILARKRAKAEAARAALQFAEKEAEMRKSCALMEERQQQLVAQTARSKADMETALGLLKIQKEAAAAQAECMALAAELEDTNVPKLSNLKDLPQITSEELTKQYVTGLDPNPTETELKKDDINLGTGDHQNKAINMQALHDRQLPSTLNNRSAPLNQGENPITTELSKFLLKKELVLSRLNKYDDLPESYCIWKASFQSVMVELGVSSTEEMDLLVKWLGPESARHAQRLRQANVHNPVRGLQQIWDRLNERYGSPELVEASLKTRLSSFPKLSQRDNKKLYELSDLLSEIEAIKQQDMYSALLAYFDTSSGVSPIVSKLPYGIQEKWTTHAVRYKRQNSVPYPPFHVFVDFISDISKIKNDPSFLYEGQCQGQGHVAPRKESGQKYPSSKNYVLNRKTEVTASKDDVSSAQQDHDPERCPLHKTRHSLKDCKTFRAKPYGERIELLKKWWICFRCCASTAHQASDCKTVVKCGECGNTRHLSALHSNTWTTNRQDSQGAQNHGGESRDSKRKPPPEQPVQTKCTQVCNGTFIGKSCAKTVLVNIYPSEQPEKNMKVYAIIDDQSNTTLVKSEFFDVMGIHGNNIPYVLSSCSGQTNMSGRRASGFVVESLDGLARFQLPTLIECSDLPDIREEIPTPDVVSYHPHLSDIAGLIPPLQEDAEILLLIGRDLIEAHHVLDQRIGPPSSPYAQRLPLGWVVIGEMCLGKVHPPNSVHVNKTYLLHDGRTSLFSPCPNNFTVKERSQSDCLGKELFTVTKDDNKIGMSPEDKTFLHIMDSEMYQNSEGNWTSPLPFREPRPDLSNNRSQAMKRAHTLDRTLKRDPVKREHFTDFMKKALDNKHAEVAPSLRKDQECWYLPIFGVYHPQKPGQVRVVFDSSAQHEGLSLNSVLLQGPDSCNSLLGILLRFREEPVAITADIQQMFFCFRVTERHRDFLRFLWYRDNDPSKDLIDYRMCVHVFGNTSSPAVATYGLRKAAQSGEAAYGSDMKHFVDNNFYVDDGLQSVPTENEAVDLLQRTQNALKEHGNLRLCKIASNSSQVMESFPQDDRAKDLKDLDLGFQSLPIQRSLGVGWDLCTDSFMFIVSTTEKPYTKRGILSTVNSVYDPLGFAAPITIEGKILLRELISGSKDWDEPLPPEREPEWKAWKDRLGQLETLRVPRMYMSGINNSGPKEVHVFSDASEKAIAAVAYMRRSDSANLGFILGKAKIAPTHGHTIPRLELCAAVLAVEIAELVSEQLDIPLDCFHFHTDSRVVLGYIHNRKRRFYIYVENRVERIHKSSKPEQWNYVPTDLNPADHGTRASHTSPTKANPWLLGPTKFLTENASHDTCEYPLSDPDTDQEIRTEKVTLVTEVKSSALLSEHRLQRFSSWNRMVLAFARLKQFAKRLTSPSPVENSVDSYKEVETFLLRQVQHETYTREIKACMENKPLPLDSKILNLDPYLDTENILRVGGRLKHANQEIGFKNPIIVSGKSHAAILLVRHHHERVAHQGRHFTEGAVRSAGLWITGAKRLISSVIHKCVTCRKLRGRQETPKMADLPVDRIEPSPPFTNVGVDTFGPWTIVTRRTRGGSAQSKRWAIMFTCLSSRAVHIEVVEDMTSSAFINALKRLESIRGKVQIFRSDRGTNFIGATDDLQITAINVEDGMVAKHLYTTGSKWLFNAPHSSHMGGVWERMIGTTRRILDSMMRDTNVKNLTHDILVTLMAEVSAIINARPLVSVSSDPEEPIVLSPATLLTQKTDHVSCSTTQYDLKDLYRSQWKQVQVLAEMFWRRWRNEYLVTLQTRQKWTSDKPNIREGDVVLLRDKTEHRNHWPMARVMTVFSSADDKVRKALLRVSKDGKVTQLTRPVSEMVLLVTEGPDQ